MFQILRCWTAIDHSADTRDLFREHGKFSMLTHEKIIWVMRKTVNVDDLVIRESTPSTHVV